VEFDIYLGESYFLAGVDKIIEEAIQKNIAIENKENNLVVVESLKNLPSFLLKKEDGSTLYLTRDLAALKKRFELFNLNLLLYVVGSEQSLHFQQLFALAEALGYLDQKNKKAEHISFGLILIEGKKMATRRGSLIEMNELLNEAVEKSKEIILVKNPEMTADKINEIAEKIGIGSVIYNSLKQSRLQSINFDWNKVLNFEAASAPYLQYSCVRIKSILKKFLDNQLNDEEEINFEKFLKDLENINFENKVELAVIKKMMFFPVVILRAQKENSPHYICTYLEELAQLFNKFYDSVSVIKTIDEKLKNSRILLIKAVLQVLEKGLNLLNIKIPEEM
jgi:arginyl-tRNA synthetase